MELNQLRKHIDALDDQLIRLFRERMDISAQIALYKKEKGLPVLDSGRERELLLRYAEMAGEDAPSVRQLYRTIFSLSRGRQSELLGQQSNMEQMIKKTLSSTPEAFPQKAIVACQGVEGSFSQEACEKLFPLASVLYFKRFDDVFRAVEQGLCRYGILPIENSAAGSVTEVYDLMRQRRFSIVRSVRLPVEQALLALPGTQIRQIRQVYSHRHALTQCGRFLEQHPDMHIEEMENTARAAKFVSESGRADAAAIASENCARLYGLSCLERGIQDQKNNYTRFICISKNAEIYPGANRISLQCALAHRPGSLHSLLSKPACAGINLVKLESRPIPDSSFAFYFYFDLEASLSEPEVQRMLGEMESEAEEFHFLGAYQEVL